MSKIYNKHKLLRYFLLIFLSCFVAIDIKANNLSEINIEGFYSSHKDDLAGISSLMSATTNSDIEGVKFFLKNNLNLINSKNIGGATALHIACREQNFEIVEILIRNKANINLQDNEGWTPLMRASLAGDEKIVKLLIKKGAIINHQNNFSESAIFHSAQANCEECFKIILKNNLKIKEADFLNIKKNILSAIEIAKKRDNQEIISSGSLWLNIVLKKIKNKAKNNDLIQKVKYLQGAKRFNIKNEENIPKFNLTSKDRGQNLSYRLSLDSAFKAKESVKNFLSKKNVNKKYQLKATLDNQGNILKKNNLNSEIVVKELPSIVAESYIK